MILRDYYTVESVCLTLFATVLLAILIARQWTQNKINIPPCPVKPWPFLGHLPFLADDPRGKILEWSKQSGDVFSLYFGTTLVVVLSGHDVLRETLVKQADVFTDKPIHGMFPGIIEKVHGIIETSGPVWKENRSTVISILRSFGMGKNVMAEKITEEVFAYMAELEKCQGEPVDIEDITTRAVSNVVCNFLIGKRFEYTDTFYKKLIKIYGDTSELAGAGCLHMWFPWLKYFSYPGDLFGMRRMKDNENKMTNFGKEFIHKVKTDDVSGMHTDNIISHYLRDMNEKQDRDQPTNMSEEELTRIINDFLVAGTETVTSTIRWFYLYMVRHPDIQSQVHEEIDREIGISRSPNIGDKAKMTFLNAAIMETQRISSIVPLGLFHRTSRETNVRGYTIPKDTHIMPHLDAVLLSEEAWGDPLNFRPQRFISESEGLLSPEQFVPFSLGRRICLGEALAKAELFLFITHVLQRYKIVPENDYSLPTLDSIMGVTSGPKPYKVKFVERNIL